MMSVKCKYSIPYDPLTAGSIDGTDTIPHDNAVYRAMNSVYTPPKKSKSYVIFVGRLPISLMEEDLERKMSKAGSIKRCRIIRDIVTGRSRDLKSMAYFDKYITGGQNNIGVKCPNCNSSVLQSNSAILLQDKRKLPNISQKKDSSDIEEEEITDWWVVDNMLTFENIGVSHTVENTKFLTCADCERGPIGYHDINTQKNFIALSRVKHE